MRLRLSSLFATNIPFVRRNLPFSTYPAFSTSSHDTASSRSPYGVELNRAQKIVAKASIVARSLQGRSVGVQKHDPGYLGGLVDNPVTVADFTIQCLVLASLNKYFPNDRFIAEESSDQLVNAGQQTVDTVTEAVEQYLPLFDDLSLKGFEDISQVIDSGVSERPYWADNARTWVLDPIDGTKGFLRGEQFCIALSLIEDGEVKLGLLACPNLSQQPGIKPNGRDEGGVIFSAELGHGASSSSIDMKGNLGEATPLEVDRLTPVVDMKRCESVESSHSMHDVAYGVANALNMKADPVRMDGQGKYGVISRGDAHLFLRLPRNNYQEYIWDVAAGYRILSEAGGHVTDLIGHPLNFSPVTVDGVPGLEGAKLDASVKGIVATTNSPGFHQSVISSLRSLLHVTQ